MISHFVTAPNNLRFDKIWSWARFDDWCDWELRFKKFFYCLKSLFKTAASYLIEFHIVKLYLAIHNKNPLSVNYLSSFCICNFFCFLYANGE